MQAHVFKANEIAREVAAALQAGKSGATLVSQDQDLGYGLILTHMKDRQPKPELHEAADDIYYILGGTGTLYLGGQVTEPSQKGPGEWTGRGIAGAETVEVSTGDVVHIPRGTAHMMGCPGGEVKYFVVKVW